MAGEGHQLLQEEGCHRWEGPENRGGFPPKIKAFGIWSCRGQLKPGRDVTLVHEERHVLVRQPMLDPRFCQKVWQPPGVVLDVLDDGVSIGTVSITSGGVFTFTTQGGTAKVIAAGSALTVVNQATADATAGNISVTFRGTADRTA